MSPFGLDDTTGEPLRDALGEVVSIDVDAGRGGPQPRADGRPMEAYRGDVERAIGDVERWRKEEGQRVVVVHLGHGPAQRMVEALGERDVPARLVEDLDSAAAIDENVVTVTCGTITQGFVDEPNRLVLVTGEDISGQKASTRDMRRMPARRKREIDPLELKAGDFVVHEQHGVGRFVEMKQREAGERRGSTSCWSTALRSAAVRRTGCTCLRRARPGHPVRRRRAAQPGPARRRRLGQAQGAGPQGGPRDRGGADQAVRRAAGTQGFAFGPDSPGSASSRTPSRSRRPSTS